MKKEEKISRRLISLAEKLLVPRKRIIFCAKLIPSMRVPHSLVYPPMFGQVPAPYSPQFLHERPGITGASKFVGQA